MASLNLTVAAEPSAKLDDATKAIGRFRNYLFARKGLSPNSVELHVGTIRRMVAKLGAFPSHEDLDGYVCDVRTAGSHSLVCNTMLAIERYQEFRGEPIHYGRPRKPQLIPEEVLTEAEIAILLSTLNTLRKRAIVGLLAFTGIRNAEVCSLRIQDVDLAGGLVLVRRGKGDQAYAASIPSPCIRLLTDYLKERAGKPDDWLFLTRRKRQMQPQDLRKIVRVAARQVLDRRVHPHLFRHSLAMALANRGAHPISIQKQLGHRNLATTVNHYLRGNFVRARAEYLLNAPSFL